LHHETQFKIRAAGFPTGSSPAELDTLTHQKFDLYRGIVQKDKSLLGTQ
jgi:hypothetical protein